MFLDSLILSIATNCAQLAAIKADGVPFDISARVVFRSRNSGPLLVRDQSAPFVFPYFFSSNEFDSVSFKAGDTLRLLGKTVLQPTRVQAKVTHISVLSHGPAPAPVQSTIADILHGNKVLELVTTKGLVRDTFTDEIDANWEFLMLSSENGCIYATHRRGAGPPVFSDRLIGSVVSLSGIAIRTTLGNARKLGIHIAIDAPEDLAIITPPRTSPYDVEDLGDCKNLAISEINSLPMRRFSGNVVASWDSHHILVKNAFGQVVQATLSTPPPPCGTKIDVVGFPVSDIYRVNLTRAIWRANPTVPDNIPPSPIEVSLSELFTSKGGKPQVNFHLFGKEVTVTGRVQPNSVGAEHAFIITDARHSISITATDLSCDAIKPGSIIKVTGTYIIETTNISPCESLPRIRDVKIVPDSESKIKIISPPPWWTPRRLGGVIVALSVGLFFFFSWNISLRRLAERRGRQLLEEEISTITSELKVSERTRLAIELHDTLSQNLTGVHFQLQASIQARKTNPFKAEQHLTTALGLLMSCRAELRQCIWDLRSEALDAETVNEAIEITIRPILGNAAANTRFIVDREQLLDTTLHTILSIIRELVSNAVNHGDATLIRIAGTTVQNHLMFSVQDNGKGFDQSSLPQNNLGLGHYGLVGIRERISRAQGSLAINSTEGKGTKVTILIPIPPAAGQNHHA